MNTSPSTFAIACMITRSSTPGMPKWRIPPDSFGMSTQRAGVGLYRPSNNCFLMSFHCGLAYFGNCSMLIRSTPGAPLLALTFFHAPAIPVLDAMYSTDTKSMSDGSITRLMSKSPVGLRDNQGSWASPHYPAFRIFPKRNLRFSQSADSYPVNAHLRRLYSTTSVRVLRRVSSRVRIRSCSAQPLHLPSHSDPGKLRHVVLTRPAVWPDTVLGASRIRVGSCH